jgi:hypothetical protein
VKGLNKKVKLKRLMEIKIEIKGEIKEKKRGKVMER